VSEVGTVIKVGDGIAEIHGSRKSGRNSSSFPRRPRPGAEPGRRQGGAVLSATFKRSKRAIWSSAPATSCNAVGQALIGRVMDALGNPIDDRGPILTDETTRSSALLRRLSIVSRERVFANGFEGNRFDGAHRTGTARTNHRRPQTGKTAVAVDTIINQRGKDVICIYVAIGQKASTVAQVVKTLQDFGAMDYTIVVKATASDPAAMPVSRALPGAAMGEYFRDRGQIAFQILSAIEITLVGM